MGWPKGKKRPQLTLTQKQQKNRLRFNAENIAWKVLATEIEGAASHPRRVLEEHGYLTAETSDEGIEAFKEVLLDVAHWFKRGKRLPE